VFASQQGCGSVVAVMDSMNPTLHCHNARMRQCIFSQQYRRTLLCRDYYYYYKCTD